MYKNNVWIHPSVTDLVEPYQVGYFTLVPGRFLEISMSILSFLSVDYLFPGVVCCPWKKSQTH